MSEITLPKKVTKATAVNPKKLVIYSQPKLGKTTILSKLEGCLLIDLEEGSDYVDAMKVKVGSLKELAELGKSIIKAGKPYKYVAIDTLSALQSWTEDYGKVMYKATPQGKNFDVEGKGLHIHSLANGAGYQWSRMAMLKWLDRIYQFADNIILVGHIKDKMIGKDGKELMTKDLALTGQLKAIVCSGVDGIGYLYKNEEGQVVANFDNEDDITCGSRSPHLQGKEIIISETDKNGNIVTHWDKIYV